MKNELESKRVVINGKKVSVREIPWNPAWIQDTPGSYRIYQHYSDEDYRISHESKHSLYIPFGRSSYLPSAERTYVKGRDFTIE